ncbi:MAG: 3-oxoacyl-ACP reductase family protein [Bdellovibrionota bacterium]
MSLLVGKKLVVTGGSRGIGKACVEFFLEQGASVAFTHTSASPAVSSWVESLQANGYKVQGFVLNLSQRDQFKATVAQITEFLGGIDGLLNNAGIARDQLMLRMKEEDFEETLNVNLKGTYFFTKECLRPLMKSETASVVFVSSVVGLMGNSGQTAYCASKAALVGLAKSLARELASRQLRVNVLAPGFIETDMTSNLSEDAKKYFLTNIPLGRLGKPVEIAQSATYLLSDMSRYVTGHVLNVNGGLYI